MKIQIIGLVLLFALFSCKKNDIENNQVETAQIENSKTTQSSGWTTIQNWSGSGNSFQSSISDKNITTAIASEGMVLLFVKANNSTHLLPVKIDQTDFYYQVEDGSISITAMGASADKNYEYTYVVFSKDQLQKLDEKGFSKSQLVKMAYEPLKQLSN